MATDILAALDTSIPSLHEGTTVPRITAACQLISACFHLSINSGMPNLFQRFLPCAALLLRSGAAGQQLVMQEVKSGGMAAEQLRATLTAQVWALDIWQLAVCCLTLPAGDAADSDVAAAVAQASAVAQTCAPPALLQQWLQCTLASMRLLQPPTWKPGGHDGQT